MDSRLSQLKTDRERVTRFCKWLSRVFYIFLMIYCLVVVLIVSSAIFPPLGFSYVGPDNVLLFVPIICNITAGGIALFVIARMLQMVGNGLSPFSLSSSRQIKILAIVLVVGVISGAVINPGTQFGSESASGAVAFGFSDKPNNAAYKSIHIDIKSLFLSIICFALSPIFRYGALLQSEADDLI